MAGIYIHIPFCKQACSYCDFYFVTRRKLVPSFVDALIREIYAHKNTRYTSETIETLYIGGGTPSLLTIHQLGQIFEAVEDVFSLEPKEITIELNPDDVTPGYLKNLRHLGVTRASMGVQSFQETLLTFMHRAHNRNEALNALEMLQTSGFSSFTVDLIYGNPGQTPEMLRDDIKQLLAFDPPHISAYSLTVEPNTRLGKQVQLGRITPPDDTETAAHFDMLVSMLAKAGLEQYEVSNFAKPGQEAVHNSHYWTHKNYLGLGPAAHSFQWNSTEAKRWKNCPDLMFYLENEPAQIRRDEENLTLETLGEERIMLGLRTRQGISVPTLKETYAYVFSDRQLSWIEQQQETGMAAFDGDSLKLTPEGLKISDLLLVDFLSKN